MYPRLDPMVARVQLISTEDSNTGVQLLIDHRPMPEYRKIATLLAVVMLVRAGEELAALPTEHAAKHNRMLSASDEGLEEMMRTCNVPALKSQPLVEFLRRAAKDPSVYWELMELPPESELLRQLLAMVHCGAYSWFRYGSCDLGGDVCYLSEKYRTLLRGLQAFLRAACGRGDSCETTIPMQSNAAGRVLGWLKTSAKAGSYAESAALVDWLTLLKARKLDNILRIDVAYV